MYINDSEKAFKMAKNSEKKFSFTLNNKIPGLKLLKYQDDNLFRLFFNYDGKYTIYFYVDFIKYLDSISVYRT